MADNNKVIFGAEFDGAGFNTGAEEIIQSLEEIKKSEATLTKGIEGFTIALKVNEKQLEQVNAEIKNLDKNSNTYTTDLAKLKGELGQVLEAKKKVTEGYKEAQRQLGALQTVTKEFNKTSFDTKQKLGDVEKAMGKLTNVSGYVGDAIKSVKNQVAGLATGLVTGFVGALVAMAIPAIVDWIKKMAEAGSGLEELRKKQKLYGEVMDEAAKIAGVQIGKLELFKNKLNDLSIPEAERIKLAKEYNKIADEQNKIDLTQINNLDLINTKIEAQNKLILARAVAVAATSKLGTFADKYIDAKFEVSGRAAAAGLTDEEFEQRVTNLLKQRQRVGTSIESGQANRGKGTNAAFKRIDEELQKLVGGDVFEFRKTASTLFKNLSTTKKELDEATASLGQLITPEGLTTKTGQTTTGGDRDVRNVFKEKLAELRAKLADASASEFQSEGLIREKFEAQLEKEYSQISRLLETKQLNPDQAKFLNSILKQINELQLTKGLNEFRAKQVAALKKIDDIILDTQIEAGNKRIANIRDEFVREGQAIEAGYNVQIETLANRLQSGLKEISDKVKAGLLTPEQGEQKTAILQAIFGDLVTQAGVDRTNRQLELAFKSFQNTIKLASEKFAEELVSSDEKTARQVTDLTNQLIAGTINYKTYQEQLSDITREGANARTRIRRAELEETLKAVNVALAFATDPTIINKLQEQQRQVRAQLAALRTQQANSEGKEAGEDTDEKRIQAIAKYAEAINGLFNQIAGFWQQVNAAEQAALERSIAIQQRRVDNAKEIAEKGNAEYLELEQKRMDALERKREENARKQLAINNALTLSNALSAAIGAISQAATSGNPFAAIAAIGSVIGAIGAAYAFVSSLQTPTANFYEGSEFVDQTGRPRGKDTIPARLHIGERVVTADTNKKYWDTLHAVHNNLVPAEVLNSFVNNFTPGAVPTMNFDRLSAATNNKMGLDSGDLLRKVDGLGSIMEGVIVAINDLAVNVKMDEHGFTASIEKSLRHKRNLKNA